MAYKRICPICDKLIEEGQSRKTVYLDDIVKTIHRKCDAKAKQPNKVTA